MVFISLAVPFMMQIKSFIRRSVKSSFTKTTYIQTVALGCHDLYRQHVCRQSQSRFREYVTAAFAVNEDYVHNVDVSKLFMQSNMDIINFIHRLPTNFKIRSVQKRGQVLLCLTSVAVALSSLPANSTEHKRTRKAATHQHHILPHTTGNIPNVVT